MTDVLEEQNVFFGYFAVGFQAFCAWSGFFDRLIPAFTIGVVVIAIVIVTKIVVVIVIIKLLRWRR